jgi:hypothetical protein
MRMGVREAINQKQTLAAILATAFVLVSVGFVAWYLAAPSMSSGTKPGSKAFFTDDDGKTFYVDSADNIPPYQHNGKQAYGCTVFTTDGGKTKTVGWLMRYRDEGKARIQEMRGSKGMASGPSPTQWLEYKKPGAPETAWVKASSPAGMEIQRPPKINGQFAEQILAN